MSASQQPTHLMNRFAHRFIRALNHLNNTTYDPNQMYQRSHRVKIAAYTAMASVVGSRRAWSRALLWKVRNRSRINRGLILLRNRKRLTSCYHRHAKKRNPNPKARTLDPLRMNYSQESKLRKLVPGAKTMDSWCLIGETADYIKCLAAQVEVMKTLVDRYTTT